MLRGRPMPDWVSSFYSGLSSAFRLLATPGIYFRSDSENWVADLFFKIFLGHYIQLSPRSKYSLLLFLSL